jgi:predicted molibdopterin-dependent oxidoreductase YjgC
MTNPVDLRIGDPRERGARITIDVDGRSVPAHLGESVATALLAAGLRTTRTSVNRGEARGAFCFMGACQECVLLIDGAARESCRTPVRQGMRIERMTMTSPR